MNEYLKYAQEKNQVYMERGLAGIDHAVQLSIAESLDRIADTLEKLLIEKTAPSLHARPLGGHDSWGAK